MEILNDVYNLEGETILHVVYGEDDSKLMIATKSGKLIMLEIYNDRYDEIKMIAEMDSYDVIKQLESDETFVRELSESNVFDVKEYRKLQQDKRQKEWQRKMKEKEESDRKLYEELKLKFEK